jgi:hypothetical protein
MPAALFLLLFFALHQDLWLWRASTPLVFGVLPVGLAYHAAYTLAVSAVMAVLVRRAWPSHLEDPHGDDRRDGDAGVRGPEA